jgi:hypothetical protein
MRSTHWLAVVGGSDWLAGWLGRGMSGLAGWLARDEAPPPQQGSVREYLRRLPGMAAWRTRLQGAGG